MMLKHLPNILTFGRLVLSVIFLAMLFFEPTLPPDRDMSFPGYLDVAFLIFIIAALTDMVDGAIARKLNVTSKFGRIIDPLADKILICGSFVVFALIGQPKLFNLDNYILTLFHWLVVGILIARDVYVTILRHIAEARGVNFGAILSGKIKVFLQYFAVGAIMVKMAHVQTALWGYWFITLTLIIMLIVTIISGFTYHIRWRKFSS